jgi:tRNA(Ile)-lysidine synthetase-like protein
VVEALRVRVENVNDNPEKFWDLSRCTDKLVVRNWRAGDRFWPAHSKSPKKIKELLQEHHITGPARKTWPVVASGDEIVWLRGFPPPATHRPRNPAEAVMIRDVPIEEH